MIRADFGFISVVIGRSMTAARDWPNQAKESRDRAAEEAAHGLHILASLLSNEKEMEYKKIGLAIVCLTNILRLLEREGAPTIPFTGGF